MLLSKENAGWCMFPLSMGYVEIPVLSILYMKVFAFLKVKVLVVIGAGLLLLGGATVAFASTTAGQAVIQSTVHNHSMTTMNATPGKEGDDQHGTASS